MPNTYFLCNDAAAANSLDALGDPGFTAPPDRPHRSGLFTAGLNTGKLIWEGYVAASVVTTPPAGCVVKTLAESQAISNTNPSWPN